MIHSINIQDFSSLRIPKIKVSSPNFIERAILCWKINRYLKRIASMVKRDLKIIKHLKKDQAENFLDTVKLINSNIDLLDDALVDLSYLGNKSIEKNMKLALTSIYNFQSKLHIAIYKDVKKENDSSEIKETISHISGKNLSRLHSA